MIAQLLACIWPFSCPECPPMPKFNNELVARYDLTGSCAIRCCAIDNGKIRPLYYFIFEGFPPHTPILPADLEYFKYNAPGVETDCNGYGMLLAFVLPDKKMPHVIPMKFSINLQTIEINIPTLESQ